MIHKTIHYFRFVRGGSVKIKETIFYRLCTKIYIISDTLRNFKAHDKGVIRLEENFISNS